MFSVNGNPILENEVDVIRELKRQCEVNGQFLFKTIRQTGNNIMVNCPFHKDGQERKPSFGIDVNTMVCHCFTCGWVGSLEEMISEIMGYADNGEFGRVWLSKSFLSFTLETRKPLNLAHISRSRTAITPVTGFTEEELDKYRYYHPYMYERGLNDEIIESFDIGFDRDSNCITFPTYNIDKTPAFIARRSIRSKFFNYPAGAQKPVYGSERFVDGSYREAVICESIFNCLSCWVCGIPAVSLMGLGTEYQYRVLQELPVRKYILGLDPDEAGANATLKLRQKLSGSKILTQYDIPQGYDLNDLRGDILNLSQLF